MAVPKEDRMPGCDDFAAFQVYSISLFLCYNIQKELASVCVSFTNEVSFLSWVCQLLIKVDIRFMELSYPRTFVSSSGTFVPWNFRSREFSFPNTDNYWTPYTYVAREDALQFIHCSCCCSTDELWLFAPLPFRFAPWLIRPLAFSPLGLLAPGSFAPWLVCRLCLADSPSGSFAPWLVRPLADSRPVPGWFTPRWIYRWFIIEAFVSVYRNATNKHRVTSLINSYFD